MNTGTKPSLNEAKCGDKSKPLLANRYFLIFYIGNVPNGKVTGYMNFTTDGCYLNKLKTIEQIKEANKNLTEIVITNIVEMSESDSKDWHL